MLQHPLCFKSVFFVTSHKLLPTRPYVLQNWGKNEKSIWAARTYVYLLLGSLRSINTKISDQIEFSLCRIHLSSCWIVSSLFFWLNLCRIDSSSSLIKVLNVYKRAAVVLGNDLATPTSAIEGRSGVSSIDFNVALGNWCPEVNPVSGNIFRLVCLHHASILFNHELHQLWFHYSKSGVNLVIVFKP